jgi:hypothetical protein
VSGANPKKPCWLSRITSDYEKRQHCDDKPAGGIELKALLGAHAQREYTIGGYFLTQKPQLVGCLQNGGKLLNVRETYEIFGIVWRIHTFLELVAVRRWSKDI